jgi:hypothetical protein
MAKKKENMLEITITVDTNDADYLTEVSEISESDLNKIKPLIEAIKKFKPYTGKTTGTYAGRDWDHHHNYPHGNAEYTPRLDLGEKPPEEIYPQFPKELHELFQEFCPYGQDGFHTVESIYITPLVKKTKLL